jgi:hypothetical protein
MVAMNKPNAIGELVNAVCEANGWSRNDVITRANRKGGALTKSRFGQLCSEDPLPGIQADKITDIALGLGVSPSRVAVAAIRAMGYNVPTSDLTPAEAIRQDETLSEDTKTALLSILRAASGEVRGA